MAVENVDLHVYVVWFMGIAYSSLPPFSYPVQVLNNFTNKY